MAQWVNFLGKAKNINVAVAKARRLGQKSKELDPKPSDLTMSRANLGLKPHWRPELVYVAKYWDDLWLGVKG